MKTSETVKEIVSALVNVQEDLVAVKDSKNPHFKNGYASLDCILDTIKPSLKVNGLTVLQTTSRGEDGITCITRIFHKSGEWIESECGVPVERQSPQGYGSSLTYARRYGLATALGIGTMDDDDGNRAEEADQKKKAAAHFKRIKDKAKARLEELDLVHVQKAFGEANIETLDKDNNPYTVGELVARVKDEAQLMAIGKRAVELSKEEPSTDDEPPVKEDESGNEEPAEKPAPAKKKAPSKKKAPAKKKAKDEDHPKAKEEEEPEPKEQEEEEPTEASSDEDPTAEDSFIEPEGPDSNIKAVKPADHEPKDDEVADEKYVDFIVDFFCKMIERTLSHDILSDYAGKKDTEWDKEARDKLFGLYKKLNEGTMDLAQAFPKYYEG
jgi:outer membrane biosynthesis protein TonB